MSAWGRLMPFFTDRNRPKATSAVRLLSALDDTKLWKRSNYNLLQHWFNRSKRPSLLKVFASVTMPPLSDKECFMAKSETLKAAVDADDAPDSIWALEDVYPKVDDLLNASVLSAANADVLIVLDTNVLLLPFTIGGREFKEIKSLIGRLAGEGRLRVPARVVREYLKNRDGKLASILKNVHDKTSGVGSVVATLPHFFKDLEEAGPAQAAGAKLSEAGSEYAKVLQKLISRMKGWRGDDPVTLAYQEIFKQGVVVDFEYVRADIEKEWEVRRASKIPPGYKDQSKSDKGLGDFLIWKTILDIGKTMQQDLIFVTGDEKADWRVGSNHQGVYPRPELIDEYRRASGGKNLELLKLAELLAQVGVEAAVVEDVREAEASSPASAEYENSYSENVIGFDYSTQNGEVVVLVSNVGAFKLHFSKASNESIHVYSTGGTRVARVKGAEKHSPLLFEGYDSSSRVYTVRTGEVFLARNEDGSTLAARILKIEDDSRGSDQDEVVFSYRASGPGQTVRAP